MDELVPPVVTTKPARGREMQTTAIPTDMFDTMRMMSVKKTLGGEDMSPELLKPTDGTAEYYHEGYIDGRLYLVPDSNLEAMKDIINFKMRPRRSTRYKHQTSYEISDYDHFRGKLDGFLTKLDNIEDLNSDLSDENYNEPREVVSEPEETLQNKLKKQSEDESEDNNENQNSEYESEDEDSKVISQVEDSSEDQSVDSESQVELNIESDETFKEGSNVSYLRFLVSGHLKKDQKPIYIIQEYNGEPDIFKKHKADFFSHKKDGNVDMFICGKFYSENMLEESDGKPVALMTKPAKIKIEEKNSKIYDGYFKDIYNMKGIDISFKGEFIKSKVTNRITPFLALSVEKRACSKSLMSPNYERKDKNPYNKNIAPTTILVYKHKYYANPFSHDVECINNGVASKNIEENSEKDNLYLNNVHETITETDQALNDNGSHQVATHILSLSCIGDDLLEEGIVDETINKPSHPYQPSSKQSKIVLIKASAAETVPVSGETLNIQNTAHTKKQLKDGFFQKLLQGNSFLKRYLKKNL